MRERISHVIQHVPSQGAVVISLAAALLALACSAGVQPRGVPLYASASAAPVPRDTVAQLMGPIAKVDGREVIDQGGSFELLPGCHVVELDRRLNSNSYALSGGTYLTGQLPLITYALRMKAGASYIIQRNLPDTMGPMVQIQLSAREVDASGKTTDLYPMKSAAEIHECNN